MLHPRAILQQDPDKNSCPDPCFQPESIQIIGYCDFFLEEPEIS